MASRIAVLVPDGFEEIELVTPVDVLRRAGLELDLVGLHRLSQVGAHGIVMGMDREAEGLTPADYAVLILPGGLPGAHTLRDEAAAQSIIKDFAAAGRIVAAICAAPLALHRAGLLEGRRCTCYPGVGAALTGAKVMDAEATVTDGKIITGRGPGAAFDFACAILQAMGLAEKATALRKGMLYG